MLCIKLAIFNLKKNSCVLLDRNRRPMLLFLPYVDVPNKIIYSTSRKLWHIYIVIFDVDKITYVYTLGNQTPCSGEAFSCKKKAVYHFVHSTWTLQNKC